MIDRRTILAAGPAVALATPALARPSSDLKVRGSKSYSESVMVMSVSADGRSALTLRFCRFPVEGFTWVWCHLLRDGQLYAFTSHDLPATSDRLAGAPTAEYRAPPIDAALTRTGRGPQLETVRLSAALPFHKSRNAPHGAGRSPGRFEGRFQPSRALAAPLMEGRDEVYGAFRAEGEIGGRRFVHEGPAKFHEQRQEAARFDTPFCYSWLAGEGMASTTLLVPPRGGGGWQRDGAEDSVTDMNIDPPGIGARRARWKLASGRAMPGRLEPLIRYEIPVYGQRWRGSFVRGEVDGRPVVGVVNDWRGDPDIYAASATRSQKW